MKQLLSLCDGWQLQGFPFEDFSPRNLPECGWLDAAVPGDAHSTLMAHGIISDPALATGDISSAWVEECVWVYRRRLSITREMLLADNLRLRFDGLDTLCDIYIDSTLLASFENMFVEHIVDLTGKIAEGNHLLEVVFHPVCRLSRKEELPDGFWINYSLERAFVRKAGYMFGWDWTPRVITCGIWRPVWLESFSDPVLNSLHARTLSIEDDRALIAVSCPHTDSGSVVVTILEDDRPIAKRTLTQKEEIISIEQPRLWWTHDQGEPYLYTVRAELYNASDECLESKSIRLGIRTIAMQTRTEDGESRYVTLLNGSPIFLKGANWVPMSNRPSTYTAGQYAYYLSLAKDACMNTIVLWGGGIYEDDAFYDFCDQNGILCWQYFMFACGEYPDWDERFIKNVRDEFEKITDRLKSHACIALWVGNVETEMLCDKIHLQRPMYGKTLFETLLPEWFAQELPGQLYVPSSPWGGDTPNSMDGGDRHNWDVWFNDLPYTHYQQDTTTFCSEFGLHAAPVRQTIESFTGKDQLSIDSFLFRYLNRDADLRRMAFYFNDVTGQPKTLEEYINSSMLIQSNGLACGVEHFRRRFPQCGGALIWQLNDCCICHSWSMVDALGIPKASYYASKRFFSPVLVSLKADGNLTEVFVTNQSPNAFEGTVHVEVGDFLGHRVSSINLDAKVPAGETCCIHRFAVGGRYSPNVIIGNRQRLFYAAAWIDRQDRFACRFFEPQKALLLPSAFLKLTMQGEDWTIETDVYAQQVRIDGDVSGLYFSDNWFDLRPGQRRTIAVRHLWGTPLQQRSLTLSAINAVPICIDCTPACCGLPQETEQ